LPSVAVEFDEDVDDEDVDDEDVDNEDIGGTSCAGRMAGRSRCPLCMFA
jgi:hypothetical protein